MSGVTRICVTSLRSERTTLSNETKLFPLKSLWQNVTKQSYERTVLPDARRISSGGIKKLDY